MPDLINGLTCGRIGGFVTLALVAVSCSSGSPDRQLTADISDDAAFSSAAPIAEYWQALNSFELEVETCMSAQGFAYEPQFVDPPFGREFIDESGELTDDEFAEQFGFGLATLQSLETADDQEPPADLELNDPLDEALEELSEEEAIAYLSALFEGSDSNTGCATQRDNALLQLLEQENSRMEKLPEIADRIEVEEYYADWASCMNENGVVADSPLRLYLDLDSRLTTVMQALDEDGLAELQNQEIDLAELAVMCGGSSRDILDSTLAFVWNPE